MITQSPYSLVTVFVCFCSISALLKRGQFHTTYLAMFTQITIVNISGKDLVCRALSLRSRAINFLIKFSAFKRMFKPGIYACHLLPSTLLYGYKTCFIRLAFGDEVQYCFLVNLFVYIANWAFPHQQTKLQLSVTKLKDKFCRDNFLSDNLHSHSKYCSFTNLSNLTALALPCFAVGHVFRLTNKKNLLVSFVCLLFARIVPIQHSLFLQNANPAGVRLKVKPPSSECYR